MPLLAWRLAVHKPDVWTHTVPLKRSVAVPQAMLSFSMDGTMIASASLMGTIIRVHSLPSATRLFSFRRGTLPATIHSLCFSPPSTQPPLLSGALPSALCPPSLPHPPSFLLFRSPPVAAEGMLAVRWGLAPIRSEV